MAALSACLPLVTGCYSTLDPLHVGKADCLPQSLSSGEYVVCPEALDAADAARDCVLQGGTLAAIGSAEENSAVADATFAIVVSSNVWLGGARSDDFVWSWPDGSVFWRGGRDGGAEPGAFVLWQPGEPNNSSSTGGEPEACLVLTVENSDWNDRNCALSLPYVCELD